MADIFAQWSALTSPTSSTNWSAIRINAVARIARTSAGGAAVLVPAVEGSNTFGLRTSHVEYRPASTLAIESGGIVETAPFAVLECSSDEVDLVRYFLRIVETMSVVAPTVTSVAAFDRDVRGIFELFRNLGRQGTHTAQGLWAEVLIVAYAKDPSYLLQAWHSDPMELHDFSANGDRLEVKSTLSAIREHDFSLEQLLRKPENTLVASIQLQEDSFGANVFDLLTRIKARVTTTDLALRAEAIVATSLGQAWRDAEEVRFNVKYSLASLQFYHATDVPRVNEAVPPNVRQVRFRSDLSAIQASGSDPASNAVLVATIPLDLESGLS